MGNRKAGSFSEKHGNTFQPGERLKDEVSKNTKDGELACAMAFEVAQALNVSADQVGKTADVLDIPLVKCQLGLFGYGEKKKIVKQLDNIDPKVEDAIRAALAEGRLACRTAWEIASRLNVPKLNVGNTCETLGIKIKPCQLGAF